MTGRSGGEKSVNAPALTSVRVVLREIERLLDLNDPTAPTQLMAGELRSRDRRRRTEPSAPISTIREQPRRAYTLEEFSWPWDLPRLPAGVYCKIAGRDDDRVWRTFDRDRARDRRIGGKWVYVFQAASPAGDDARLFRELSFGDDGAFKLVRLEPDEARDQRPAGGAKATELLLDLQRFTPNAAAPVFYFPGATSRRSSSRSSC